MPLCDGQEKTEPEDVLQNKSLQCIGRLGLGESVDRPSSKPDLRNGKDFGIFHRGKDACGRESRSRTVGRDWRGRENQGGENR